MLSPDLVLIIGLGKLTKSVAFIFSEKDYFQVPNLRLLYES